MPAAGLFPKKSQNARFEQRGWPPGQPCTVLSFPLSRVRVNPAYAVNTRIHMYPHPLSIRLASVTFFALWSSIRLCAAPAPEAAVSGPAILAPLPDPLLLQSGQPIRSEKQWKRERRPELLGLFQQYMYGTIPPAPKSVRSKVLGEFPDFLGGKATLKLVTLETGPGTSPRINLMLVVPNQRQPAPVFLAMNFCGNQALTDDPRVPIREEWTPNFCTGCTNNRPTEASRGAQAKDWPLAEIVRRGYALAAFYSGDIDSDRADVSDGLYAYWPEAIPLGIPQPTGERWPPGPGASIVVSIISFEMGK